MSEDSIRLLQGPPMRQWIGWMMWAMHFGWAIRDWISVIDVGVSFGFAVLATALRKGLKRRALWVTNEEIIIARRRVLTFKPSQLLRGALNPERGR